jgi:lipopolysaccharide export LptBFGC system permease protein LptF
MDSTAPLDDAPTGRFFHSARLILMVIAVAAAVAGLLAVGVVVILGLMHQTVPTGLIAPFLALLPVAFVALALTVILGAIQRKHN